jgi:hypothetical protein
MNKDEMDEEAEREGIALERSREFQAKKPGKKSKTKSVNTKVLDEVFLDHYGRSGYPSRKESEK